MINAVNLCKKYGADEHEVVALSQVDFRIESGEQVSIVGKSGSGKSTLLNLLGGLDRPSSGELSVFEHKLSDLTRTQMAQSVRILAQ